MELRPLNALLIYLFWCNPDQYGGESFTAQKLCEDLNQPLNKKKKHFSEGQLSRLRQGRESVLSVEDDFSHVLEGKDNLEKRGLIAHKLGFPDLFTFSSQKDLIEGMSAAFPALLGPQEVVIQDIGRSVSDFIGKEKRIVNEIAVRLNYSAYPVLSWSHRFDVGAAQLLHKLVSADDIGKNYRQIAHLWPSSFNAPFQAELLQLCCKLSGKHPVPVSPAGVLKLFRESQTLVIVHLIETIELSTIQHLVCRAILMEIRKEVESISTSDLENNKCASRHPLLLLSGTRTFFDIVGRSDRLPGAKRKIDEIANKINEALMRENTPEERARVMREARLRVTESAHVADIVETGPLLRRAELTHEGNRIVEAAPVHQRIRALAIARHNNRSSFLDPTVGFEQLVGGDYSQHLDIALFHREVTLHVDYLWERNERTTRRSTRERGRQKIVKVFDGAPHLATILMVSTGLHWLSRNALEKLQSVRIEPAGIDLGRREGNARPQVSDNQYWIHQEDAAEDSVVPRYFCSLGAKAILQDTWKRRAPAERRRALYLVAEFLDSIENDKLRLPEEYPYAPHWGRSRIYFLGEKIRFLVRALDETEQPCVSASAGHPLSDQSLATFPKVRTGENSVPGAREVINYCYRIVFRQEMNGDRSNDNKRNLSKRHGAFKYAAELLALMSANEEIGLPHPELDDRTTGEFIRECGLALLDLGLLSEATRCFERLEKMTEAQLKEQGEAGDAAKLDVATLEHLDAMLVSTLSLFAKGDLDGGSTKVRKAEQQLAEWEHRRISKNKEKGSPDWRIRQQFQNRKRQIQLRRAQMLYLGGDMEDCRAAVDLLTSLEPKDPTKIKLLFSDPDLHRLVEDHLPRIDDKLLATYNDERERESDEQPEKGEVFARRAPLDAELSLLKIAALRRLAGGAADENAALNTALRVCLKSLLSASSAGMHHDAMGFRISLASIYRRLGSLAVAEAVVDEVHSDLLSFGGSERTYLAFLAEAGRILIETDRVIHGYATYLRPCILRASSLGFERTAARMVGLVVPQLEMLLNLARESEVDDDAATLWHTRVASALADHKRLDYETSQFRRDGNLTKSAGSLFAYSIAEARTLIMNMRAVSSIEAELSLCQNIRIAKN